MSAKSQHNFPEVFISTSETTVVVSRAVKAGTLRKLASRLYTSNLKDLPEDLVRRHLWQIVAGYFPGALIADRTALENAPAPDGSVWLISDKRSELKLPGLRLHCRKGLGALPTDLPFIRKLYISSTARAYLENMSVSRARNGKLPRTLSRSEIEERLDGLVRRSGEEAVNKLRDEVRKLAPVLDLEKEAKDFDQLVGGLLGTRETELYSATGKARNSGQPYDPERIKLFQLLHVALRSFPPLTRVSLYRNAQASRMLSFFEAYFSNFIEGTQFEVGEAADIVFNGVIPSARPEDAHDVLGTWRVVSSHQEMSQTPKTVEEFLQILRRRHASIMGMRPDAQPGEFKQIENRAGSTIFVKPDLVVGTLKMGFEIYQGLETPFERAVFMMFMVSEVHPFADGNGRAARIMMNAELISEGEERIIIPTIYRNNYLSALKAISQSERAEALIRTLDFAQKWTGAIEWGDLKTTQSELDRCNAFLDPNIAEDEGKRLRLPVEY